MRRQEEAERKRRIEEEVEKVKRRREEREEEAAWLEEEKARASRQQEEEQHAEWEKKADDFHLKQAHERSKIRINEGRAKPIDMLAKNLISDDMDLEMSEPYKIFRGPRPPFSSSNRFDSGCQT
jgi:transposase